MVAHYAAGHTDHMKPVAQNRRARYDYAIDDTMEAGLILTGQEAKSCRGGHVHVHAAYVSFVSNTPFLKGMKIAPYAFASGLKDYDPGRDRKLLLSKAQTAHLLAAVQEKGVTVIPMEVRAGKYIKVLLGLGRGVKRHDKRQRIREREQEKKLKKGQEY
ncbi:SsrA-binding protein [Candidatus Peregrinibacteria bacterium CG10_big_fil_rev_8_21_14_0_10_55_24]|nr:MAG: SsrA-binding protein [Candidatus Peregrinibacteria bacterium CG10_big_fil_rev_8_21_14_0_10_55_24]